MCRNIKQLHNFEPPATEAEIEAAAIQFVRKIGGFTKPSAANQAAFDAAVAEISKTSKEFLASLVTNAAPKNREAELAKSRELNRRRFGDGK